MRENATVVAIPLVSTLVPIFLPTPVSITVVKRRQNRLAHNGMRAVSRRFSWRDDDSPHVDTNAIERFVRHLIFDIRGESVHRLLHSGLFK